MNFYIQRFVAIFFICFAFISKAAVYDNYKKAAFSIPDAPRIINPSFEKKAKGWKLPSGYTVDLQGGRNGSSALMYERRNKKEYCLGQTTIKVKPDTRYHYGVWIRCKNVKGARSGATLCLEYFKNGKWQGGDYPKGIKGTRDWTFLHSTTTIPKDITECRLSLYFRKEITGQAWFDDVEIKSITPRLSIDVVYPAYDTITTINGKIRINIYYENIAMRAKVDSFKLGIKVFKGDILTNNSKAIKSLIVPVNKHIARADLKGLSKGNISLQLTLFDPNKKIILGERTVPFKVIDPQLKIPSNACKIDKLGRSIVNGKPYMPLGVYMQNLSREDVDRIAASPFNCVMPYQSLDLRLKQSTPKSLAAIRQTLDYCNNKGIKVIFSLKDQYKGMGYAKKTWYGANGYDEVVTKAVNSFKKHPALLAWYINDEHPKSMLGKLIARRRLVNKLDPFHPTWAVICKFAELPLYSSACDIMGVDSYPISNKKTQDMQNNVKGMDAADLTSLPVWAVPQIMNWGTYAAKGHTKTFKKNFRDPTEEEIRSMALFFALRGARGFIFYSYFDLKRAMDKKRFNPPAYTSHDFDRRWAEICRMGNLMRKLEPFLLSPQKRLRLKLYVKKGNIEAREFTDTSGNKCIIITAIGPGKAEAVIMSDSSSKLKSLYGKCTYLGQQKYLFKGNNVCSDVLISLK